MDVTLLALKLCLVPFFLGVISLAGRRWGPGIAGWLAGLPVIVGPILFLLALERGAAYARDAAVYTLGAVFPVIVFGIAYSWTSRRKRWPASLLAGYAAWLLAAFALLSLPLTLEFAATLALVTLLVAPWLFPKPHVIPRAIRLPAYELGMRMLMGALLTLLVTSLSSIAPPGLSGLLALIPVLSAILAAFTQRTGGADAVITLLAALARGLWSLAVFCLVLPIMLAKSTIPVAFISAVVAALLIQAALRKPAVRRESD